MISYVAFLRAINVSGHRLIKMEALRAMFEIPGIKNVRTYIQSGNVLFDAKETDEAKLTAKIEKQLLKESGYDVEVFLHTKDELQDVLKNIPFKDVTPGKSLALYITFLQAAPTAAQKKEIEAMSNEVDTLRVRGREIYALVVKDGAKSLFSNMLIEKKLKQKSTGRNQTTVHKLLDMMNE